MAQAIAVLVIVAGMVAGWSYIVSSHVVNALPF